MVMLAYQYAKDEKYLVHVEQYLDSFEDRAVHAKHISHDMGFLYTLSCVSVHKLLGTKRAYKTAYIAADLLAQRYNEKGGYIQAWGDMGIKYPDVKIIIDCMMNLPLLYWTGKKRIYRYSISSCKNLCKPNTNVLWNSAVIPTFCRRLEPGDHRIITSVLGEVNGNCMNSIVNRPNIQYEKDYISIQYGDKQVIVEV